MGVAGALHVCIYVCKHERDPESKRDPVLNWS